jgi:uncharacterized protein YlxW (UPF0749 family)
MSPEAPTDPGSPRSNRRLRMVGLLLLALLGFGLAASVRSQRTASTLATTRPSDLVRILDDLDARASVLRSQITDLQNTRSRLSGSGSDAAALAEARTRTQDLAILAGTIAAQGPGIEVTVTDPQHAVTAEVLVDTVEELRDAGAETLDLAGVRLGATSWIEDANTGLSVDGHAVQPPYLLRAIGDPATMQKALDIPGGVVDTVDARAGAAATIKTVQDEQIRSLRVLPPTG